MIVINVIIGIIQQAKMTFEIDKDYYEAAQKRLQAVMSQVSMFREVHHEK